MILDILLGVVPEALFIWFIVSFAKQATIKQSIYTLIGFLFFYILLIILIPWNIWFYLLLFISYFLIIRAVYMSSLVDITLITTPIFIIVGLSYLCVFLVPNYYIALITHRIILILICIFTYKFLPTLYRVLLYSWDRREPNLGIKSLTIRNWSIIGLNITFILLILSLAIQI